MKQNNKINFWLMFIIIMAIGFIIGWLLETWGLIGYAIVLLCLLIFKFWKMWPAYIAAKHNIESYIWGKPLYTMRRGELGGHHIIINLWGLKFKMKSLFKFAFLIIAGVFFKWFTEDHYATSALMFLAFVLLFCTYKISGDLDNIHKEIAEGNNESKKGK